MTVADAERWTAQGAWASAGQAWSDVGDAAARGGHVGAAREALSRAGECHRRDDRPDRAISVLERGLALDPTGRDAATVARLAACWSELGRLDVAWAAAVAAIDGATGADRVVLADTLVAVALGRGDAAGARRYAAGLPGVLGRFREGQLAFVDGDPEGADAALSDVARAVGDHPSVRAAVGLERAEVAVALGRSVGSAVDDAEQAAAAAGRRSLVWRARAVRGRLSRVAGVYPIAPAVDEGARWAADRGLRPLEVDLAIAAGRDASALARSCGLTWAEGWCAWARGDLEAARVALEAHRSWRRLLGL